LTYEVYSEEAECDGTNLMCTYYIVESDNVLYRYNDPVFVTLYRGYVIVAETVSRLTLHGSRDTAVDGKVTFAHFVLMVFNLQI
jgi:hypothetical protein